MRSRVSFNLIFRLKIRRKCPGIAARIRRLRFPKNSSSAHRNTRLETACGFSRLESFAVVNARALRPLTSRHRRSRWYYAERSQSARIAFRSCRTVEFTTSFPIRIDDVRDVLIDANICFAVGDVCVLIGAARLSAARPCAATSPLTEISPEVLFPNG